MLSLPPNLIDNQNILIMISIRFEKKPFLEALKTASMCAGRNTSIPILENIRMRSNEDGSITMMSSSLDVTIDRKIMPSEPFLGEFDFCVQSKDLNSAVSRLSDFVFLLNIDTENNYLEVSYGSGRIKLPIVSSDEFPFTGVDSGAATEGTFLVKSSSMSYIVDTCKDFVGNDELRPNMMCVYIGVGTDGNLEYCATDAHRLVHEKIPLESQIANDISFMLPKRAFAPVKEICANESDVVRVDVYDTRIVMSTDISTVTTTKPEGKYPNFAPLISVNNDKRFRVNKVNLFGAVNRMMSAATANTQMVRFNCSSDIMKLESEDVDFGKAALEKVEVSSSEGDDIVFGLNGLFFKDCIDIVEDNFITITASQPNRAVIMLDDSHPSRTLLLMPVMLNA